MDGKWVKLKIHENVINLHFLFTLFHGKLGIDYELQTVSIEHKEKIHFIHLNDEVFHSSND